MKTARKYVFHPRGAHILSQLNVLVLYTFFLGFEKYRVLAQNLKWLAFGFIDKHLSVTKID
jgi:predicted RNA-binding protein associated with RNAse of E/G family